MDYNKAAELLSLHEGIRQYPYRDSEGILSIGIGFNLEDEGLYPEEINFILHNRMRKYWDNLVRTRSWITSLSPIRQLVLIDMVYNLGITRLSGFKKMWKALEAKKWGTAAAEMLDSKWARQVGPRATRLARMMETGEWHVNT